MHGEGRVNAERQNAAVFAFLPLLLLLLLGARIPVSRCVYQDGPAFRWSVTRPVADILEQATYSSTTYYVRTCMQPFSPTWNPTKTKCEKKHRHATAARGGTLLLSLWVCLRLRFPFELQVPGHTHDWHRLGCSRLPCTSWSPRRQSTLSVCLLF